MRHFTARATFAVASLVMSQVFSGVAFAASLIEGVHVPDPGLRDSLESNLGIYPGDPITETALAAVKSLNLKRRWESLPIADLTGLEFCHNLEVLRMEHHRVADLAVLSGLLGLREIYLRHNQISDLTALTDLTGLKVVELAGNRITDISDLAGLTLIRRLDLSSNGIVDLTPLAHLPDLKELYLSHNLITDISPLSGLVGLVELLVDHNRIRDLSSLANFRLGVLDLSHNQIDDLAPLDVGELYILRLGLNDNELTDISPLSELHDGLHILNLAGNRIQDLTPLVHLSRIENTMFLGHNNIADISALADLRVRTLHLNANGIDDISALATVQGLQHALLSDNSISDISPLASMDMLSLVDLRHNPLDENADSFKTTIETLKEQGTYVFHEDDHGDTWSTASDLAFGSTVTGRMNEPDRYDVDVFRLQPEEATFASIIDFTKGGIVGIRVFTETGDLLGECHPAFECRIQAYLEPRAHYIEVWTDHSTARYEIGPVEHVIPEIPDLNLRYAIQRHLAKPLGQSITSIEMKELYYLIAPPWEIADLTGLELATNLRWLNLSGNRISDISPLQQTTRLESLNLSGNAVADISPLRELQDLKDVNLSDNHISDVSSLANKTKLRNLTLDRNEISVIAPLVNLDSLETLSIEDNLISDLSRLPTFKELKSLNMGGNTISDLTPLNRNRLPALSGLYIQRNSIADIQPLTSLPSLNWLDLSKNRIADASPIGDSLWSLSSLDLTDNQLVDIGPLLSHGALDYLTLGGNRIRDISDLEPWPSTLKHLELQRNSIRDIGPLVRNEDYPYGVYIDLRHNHIEGQDVLSNIKRLGGTVQIHDDHADAINEAATPLGIGSRQSGVIDPSYETDVFELETGGGLNIAVYTTGDLDTHGWLYDVSGRELAYDSEGGERDNMLIEGRFEPGIYRIVVAAQQTPRYRMKHGPYVINAGVRIRSEPTLTVSWDSYRPDPSDIGFAVLATPVDGSESRSCTASADATSCVLANLNPGTVYQISVQRRTSDGSQRELRRFGVSEGPSTGPEELRNFWRGWRLFLLVDDQN